MIEKINLIWSRNYKRFKSEGGEFTGGNITDPKNGKTYKCTVKQMVQTS